MAPRCRPPGPCFRAAPHGGRGCQQGPGRSRGHTLHALGPRSGRCRDAGRVWASGGALPCTPAFTPAARGRRGPGGRGRRGAGCARGGRVWWAAAAACGPCTRAARGPSSQGPARAVPSVPSVGRVVPAGRWGQRPARRASLCAHCGRRRPPPRPPETPSSSSLAVSGSGRRSRGAGPSAGWTSDWTSRPWRVVCLRWPWTAQDSASKPSLWPFPLTPPVLVPGQGHGGAGLGPDGGRDAQVGPRGLIARLALTSVQVRPGESLRRPVAPHPAWRRASHSDPPPPTRRGAAE